MTSSSRSAENLPLLIHQTNSKDPKNTIQNFYLMAIFFSANHGCMVSCLSLATSRLGSIGSIQSGVLSLSYVASSIFGATYVVKRLGGRNSMILGMMLYCVYAAGFLVATVLPGFATLAALSGAMIGGFGAGISSIAQGTYLARAASQHAKELSLDVNHCTTKLAGGFAFLYLAIEVAMRLTPTILAKFISWQSIFAVNTSIAVLSTFGMMLVMDYGPDDFDDLSLTSTRYKMTSAFRLLIHDTKMRYMIWINVAFGLTASFQNSYVNGEVEKVVNHDPDSIYVGLFSSWIALSAATMSLVLPKVASNEFALIFGIVCYFFTVFPFIIQPDTSRWTPASLLLLYSLHGIGRATFESTLKAVFIEFFPSEPAGAFSNLILQFGLSSSFGYFLTFRFTCKSASKYCIEYSDQTWHNLLGFEVSICIIILVAVWGFRRAMMIHHPCQEIN
jgi:MFS family permease